MHNFISQRVYLGRSVSQQMHEPYSRVLLMGEATLIIALTIAAKIAVDIRAHRKPHA